ncbi:MAG TPA: serine/threonine-protein kinase [Polyangiaceae bacterium]|nr:serine/threonine-protein kinase [Polyangiaceae bacterium]
MAVRNATKVTIESTPLQAGQALGRYELLAPIAKGGMGQVWVGRLRGARGFQKLVAIKTLLAVSEDSERRERMLFEEARIAALIQHSNVVQTIELGEHHDSLYMVMEWVDGEPLSYLLKHCEPGVGMPLLIAVNLVAQTLRGLQAAHDLCDGTGASLGVVHRDVSPHNVLVSYGGVAKLVDFGIAKAMNQEVNSTTTGEIKGKFAYMAPEQILGNPVDRRADVFSVGIMLHLMTSGHHPFKNHESIGVLHSITSNAPARKPSSLRPGYSAALEEVVMRALEKDRERRWASADEMREALQRAVPEAFAVGFDSVVESFMSATCGQRAAAKREALRRVEQRADAILSDGRRVGPTAQSASSLRAVSVDTSAAAEDAAPARLSYLPTLQPPPEPVVVVTPNRRPWIAAGLIGSGLVAIFSLVVKPYATQSSAGQPSSELVQLAPPSAVHPLPVDSSATPAAAQAPTPPETTIPPVSSDAGAPQAVAQPSVARAKSKPAKAPPKPASLRSPNDLIAPDYAR